MSHPYEFGLDTFGDVTLDISGSPHSHAQTLRDVIDEAVLAEKVGVDAFGVGEHQRRDIAEIALQIDRPGALRQVVDRLEPTLEVVPLLRAVGDVFLERDVDDRHAGAADRLDAIGVRVLGDLLLDLARDELLDALGLGARPRARGDRSAASRGRARRRRAAD